MSDGSDEMGVVLLKDADDNGDERATEQTVGLEKQKEAG